MPLEQHMGGRVTVNNNCEQKPKASPPPTTFFNHINFKDFLIKGWHAEESDQQSGGYRWLTFVETLAPWRSRRRSSHSSPADSLQMAGNRRWGKSASAQRKISISTEENQHQQREKSASAQRKISISTEENQHQQREKSASAHREISSIMEGNQHQHRGKSAASQRKISTITDGTQHHHRGKSASPQRNIRIITVENVHFVKHWKLVILKLLWRPTGIMVDWKTGNCLQFCFKYMYIVAFINQPY